MPCRFGSRKTNKTVKYTTIVSKSAILQSLRQTQYKSKILRSLILKGLVCAYKWQNCANSGKKRIDGEAVEGERGVEDTQNGNVVTEWEDGVGVTELEGGVGVTELDREEKW